MATYKLIQDIEAEDHILGPLSLRQFIFAIISVVSFYICFILLTKHLAFLLIVFLPPALFFGFFAFPFGKDQPTEVWALAKLRYYFKPRQRIWNQSGVKELVTITVPKKIERNLTNGLSQNEVKSRLSALANTIDSRGWAIKNVTAGAYSQPNPLIDNDSDRLIDIHNLPREVPADDIKASEDILDATNNPVAQQFDQMITTNSQNHRKQLIEEMNGIRQRVAGMPPATPADYWFMNPGAPGSQAPADQTVFGNSPLVLPGVPGSEPAAINAATPTADDTAFAARLKASHDSQQISYSHLRTLQPLGSTPLDQPQAGVSAPPDTQLIDDYAADTAEEPFSLPKPVAGASPAAVDPAILSLSRNNDLNVATLAREAQKAKQAGDSLSGDEVVVSLR